MKFRVGAAIFAACAFATAARADNYMSGLYTVINYSGAYPDFRKQAGMLTPSYLDGVEADVGWRFNRFYSVEASYSYYTGSNNSSGETFNNTLQTGSIDALGYLPFPGSSWALYGDVGGTAYFENAGTTLTSVHDNSFGARAGGGMQFQFTEDLGLRVSGRYEWTDLSHLKSAEVFSVGLVWQR